jgi:SAM-dependent methyltransferase
VNRSIYENVYTAQQLALPTETPYSRAMVRLRLSLIERYAGPVVVDLCCGSGSYALAASAPGRRIIGLDFSGPLLRAARDAASPDAGIALVQCDATRPAVQDGCADLVYSFSSLYYVDRLDEAIAGVARMLRPGGHAIIELGNRWSLNTLVANEAAKRGWAKSYHVPYSRMRSLLRDCGLQVMEWRALQLLPMQGTPRRLAPLMPLLSTRWRRLLGLTVRGRLLDEWLSSLPGLRRLAFRHVIVVRRP